MIYLDNAATTKPYQEVIDVYLKYLDKHFLNPSSVYASSSSELEEQIKANILRILKTPDSQLVFTSSATEANNLAIFGFLAHKTNKNVHIITSNVEHASVLNVFKALEVRGVDVTYLSLNKDHKIDIDEFKNSIKPNTIFASFMGVNNELGSILNIKELYEVCQQHKIVLHCDMSQAIFKNNEDLQTFCDCYTISSHKLHGLKSISALVFNYNVTLDSMLYGGNQEYGLRSSTVDIPLIASFYKAIEINAKKQLEHYKKVSELYDYAVKKSAELDYLQINSNLNNSSKYILNFSFVNNVKASIVIEYLANKNIFVSTTSACNSKKEKSSYVVYDVYKDATRAANTMRISFDENNTIEEIDTLFSEIDKCVKERLWKI